MGSCCDDHRQPRRCGQFCSPGCTGCHRVTHCLGVADPRGPSRTHLAVVLQGLVRATDPKFRRGHAPRHSIRADSPALDPSPAHPTALLSLLVHRQVSRASSRTRLRLRTRPPRVQTASLQMRPQPLDTLIQLTITHEGDIPRGRVRVLPGGGIRRRRGQQSRPRTRHLSPAAQKCPRTRRMPSAAAPECGVFMPRPKTPVRRAGFDCRYSPPRQGVTRLLAVTRMAPVIYCTRVGCHWRRVGCTPGRWDLRAVRTTPGQ